MKVKAFSLQFLMSLAGRFILPHHNSQVLVTSFFFLLLLLLRYKHPILNGHYCEACKHLECLVINIQYDFTCVVYFTVKMLCIFGDVFSKCFSILFIHGLWLVFCNWNSTYSSFHMHTGTSLGFSYRILQHCWTL